MTPEELAEIECAVNAATEGPWAFLACGEKDNSWQVGRWQRPDGTDVVDEVGDDDARQYEAAGYPDLWENEAVCIETVCENASSSASLSDAAFIAEARTLVPALVAELRAERERSQTMQAEMDRRLDVLRRMADAWLKTASDDKQLCMAHDFFTGVLNPPAAVSVPEDQETR